MSSEFPRQRPRQHERSEFARTTPPDANFRPEVVTCFLLRLRLVRRCGRPHRRSAWAKRRSAVISRRRERSRDPQSHAHRGRSHARPPNRLRQHSPLRTAQFVGESALLLTHRRLVAADDFRIRARYSARIDITQSGDAGQKKTCKWVSAGAER